ncbi:MAG: hypothetical protein U1F11_07150 [Steroidobacteraceae bacterium]
MKKGNEAYALGAGLLLLLAGSGAQAQDERKGCIALQTVAQTEQEYVDERGQRATRLVPAAKVVPGMQVVWTVTASNVCDRPADKVFIDNPVPQHMSYVPQSAFGAGADIQFSLDGRRFAAADALQVQEADGHSRAARSDEYTHIRWNFRNPIGPGQVAIASFRATLK